MQDDNAKSVKEFNKAIKEFEKLVPMMQADILKKVSLDAFRYLQDKTPKDSGRAAGGWNANVNSKPSEWKPPSLPKGYKRAKGTKVYSMQAFNGLSSIRFNSFINLSNNVEYIGALDDGHSKIQAPDGIVAPVFARMTAYLNQQLAKLSRMVVK